MNSEKAQNIVDHSHQGEASVVVSGVSKCYKVYDSMSDRIKQTIFQKNKGLYREFWALKEINLTLAKGETIGIIGKNGSGKSTLLQLICGIIKPTTGSIYANGRIAALLELGTGFNPEFTGHENIFVNGALLGLKRKEINELYDSIIGFADIGNFIHQPIKTYSSGMMVRLAFSIAICAIPDILIIDEALAVGDEYFQKKCYSRIRELQESNCTIIFVSHALQTINSFCSQAVLIDSGELLAIGEPKQITSIYQKVIYSSGTAKKILKQELKSRLHQIQKKNSFGVNHELGTNFDYLRSSDHQNIGTKHQSTPGSLDENLTAQTIIIDSIAASINHARILSEKGSRVNVLQQDCAYQIVFEVLFNQNVANACFGAMIKTIKGVNVSGMKTQPQEGDKMTNTCQRGQRLCIQFPFKCILNPGLYSINLTVWGESGIEEQYVARVLDALAFKVIINEPSGAIGIVNLFETAIIS
jgi:lipopolysaccharide transport system ATP-binding protein